METWGSPTDRNYVWMVRCGESLLLGYGHEVDRYVTPWESDVTCMVKSI